MTTRSRIAILIASALALSLLAFDVHEKRRRAAFRAVCRSVERGAAPEDVARALRAAGGEEYSPYPDPRTRAWHLNAPVLGHISRCTVALDEHGVVLGAARWGDRPK